MLVFLHAQCSYVLLAILNTDSKSVNSYNYHQHLLTSYNRYHFYCDSYIYTLSSAVLKIQILACHNSMCQWWCVV